MAQGKVGSLYFTLGVNASDFEKKLNMATAKIADFGEKAKRIGQSMSLFITTPILAAGTAAVKMASDYDESLNKVDVAFKDASGSVKAFGDTSLKTFGIAKGTALDMAALFGDMATSMGIGTQEAANLSTSLVGLAGDLASFKNMNIKEVTTALNGVFTGETESLKRLGVVMTEVNLEQFAMNQGITKTIQEMTQAEKVLLRYQYVMQVTANAHGDFERTGGGAANQMRVFTEGLKELAVQFGQVILPAFTRAIKAVNGWMDSLMAMDEGQRRVIITIGAVAAATGPLLIALGTLGTLLPVIVTGLKAVNAALLSNPFTLIVAGVVALGVALVKVYNNSEAFRDSVGRIGNAFSNLWGSVKPILSDLFRLIGQLIGASGGFSDVWITIFATFSGVINAIAGRLIGLVKTVSNVIRAIDLAFKGEFKGSGIALANAVQSAFDTIDPRKIGADFMGAFNDVIKNTKVESPQVGVSFRGSKVYEAMAKQSAEANVQLTNTTKAADKAIGDLFDTMSKKDVFATAAASIKDKFITSVEAAINPLKRIDDILNKVGQKVDLLKGFGGDVKTALDPAQQALSRLFESFTNKPKADPLRGMGENVLAEIDPSQQALNGLFATFEKNAAMSQAMADAVSQAFQSMGQNLLGSLLNSENGFERFVGNLGQMVLKLVSMMLAQSMSTAIAGATASGTATGPAAVFTTPAFIATAVSGILGAFAAIPKFATGGAVTGPTLALVGENPASRGEAIIPFERMGSFLQQFGMGTNGDQHITISGQLAGDTIRLSGESATNKIGSVRWGRALVN